MRIADLHCDTISCLTDRGGSLIHNQYQFDLERAQSAQVYLQFFALFTMPADSNIALRSIMKQADKYLQEMENHTDRCYHLTSSQDLENEKNINRVACILHLEGAECLGNDVEILQLLYRLGLRSMGLTWNHRNLLADGGGEGEYAGGLSRKGKEVINRMEKLRMILDLSHISEPSYYDALELYSLPVMVTHANARSLCPHWRNLSDGQLRALAQHGGVVGITQVADFVKENQASLDDMIDHIAYIADLIGVEHVALGSDFDGADNMVIPDVAGYARLPQQLLRRGFSQYESELICGKNAIGVIKSVL
jgi:Zn-dependent dipeptidase, microsomal dipeptidase homolog